MAKQYARKVQNQMNKAGLPQGGAEPFEPNIVKNHKNEDEIEKKPALTGPKKGKFGYVDTKGRIWLRDRAHSTYLDHWDVQENGGVTYFRVDDQGNRI